jgi:hypothetical protein
VIQSSTWSYVVAGSACTEDGEKSVHPCLPWPKVVTQRLTPTTSGKSKIASYQQLCIANLTSNRRGISDKQFAFEERGDAKIRCLSLQCISLAQQPELSRSSSPRRRCTGALHQGRRRCPRVSAELPKTGGEEKSKTKLASTTGDGLLLPALPSDPFAPEPSNLLLISSLCPPRSLCPTSAGTWLPLRPPVGDGAQQHTQLCQRCLFYECIALLDIGTVE